MIPEADYQKAKDFVSSLIDIKEYIEANPRKDIGTDIDRFIFSMLVMFDGDSGTNDFHSIDLGFNKTLYLHELYGEVKEERENESKPKEESNS